MPCQRIAPTFEALAREFDGKAKFAKVNAEKTHPILQEFGVKSIPTFIVFKNGVEINRKTGACDHAMLSGFLRECLEEKK